MKTSMPLIRVPWAIYIAACLALLAGNGSLACSVPVFRYALERFPADAYRIVVYYRGSLPERAKTAVDTLKRLASQPGPAPNIELKTVDLDSPSHPAAVERIDSENAVRPEWTPPKDSKLPWLAVMLPGDSSGPLLSSPLEIQDLPRLVDSPARRELVKRLTGGETAVFLLVKSGRKEEDAKTAKLLTTAFERMQKELKVPVDDGTVKLRSTLPVRIAFSALAIRRDDPAEALLVKTVEFAWKQSNPDQKEDGGPIVCPVFGRGRILGASSGKYLSQQNIEDAGQFLCGPCACSLKGEIPGADLLLTADWEALLENRVVQEDLPALRSLGALADAARAAAVSQASASQAEDAPLTQAISAPQESNAGPRSPGLAAGMLPMFVGGIMGTLTLVVLILGGWMWIIKRNRGSV